jgi:hypothetical protein
MLTGFARMTIASSIVDESTVYTATFEFVTPTEVTPRIAVNYGYNMLDVAPYVFLDTEIGSTGVVLQGVLPYNPDGSEELFFTAKSGESIKFRLYYQYPDGDVGVKTYKVKWEYQDLNTGDYAQEMDPKLADSPEYDPGEPISCIFSPSAVTSFAVKCSLYTSADSFAEPDSVIILPAYNLISAGSVASSVSPVSYDLATAKGMSTWNSRALVWGVTGAKNMLFMSDINDISYFPYPNNIQLFSEEVLSVVEYQSDLLVFTTTSIHRLSFMSDGITITDKTIQQNLRLSFLDREFVQVIRNMVFFKCGDAYHMIVPNSVSSIGELRLAPVSNPITNLILDMGPEILRTVDNMYNIRSADATSIALVDGYNYLDGAIIRNVYRIALSRLGHDTLYFDYILNYDSDQRAWSTYIQATSDTRMTLYRVSAASFPIMAFLNVLDSRIVLQFLQRDMTNCTDWLEIGAPEIVFGNRQYLDTGFRDLDAQTKKRFREMQFKVNTAGGGEISFHHEFFVDEDQRRSFFYTPTQIDEGTFSVVREYLDPIVGADGVVAEVLNPTFTLPIGNTQVTSTIKIRFPVSGKGYCPRMRLLCIDERPYEYLSQNWIYRMMNTR